MEIKRKTLKGREKGHPKILIILTRKKTKMLYRNPKKLLHNCVVWSFFLLQQRVLNKWNSQEAASPYGSKLIMDDNHDMHI